MVNNIFIDFQGRLPYPFRRARREGEAHGPERPPGFPQPLVRRVLRTNRKPPCTMIMTKLDQSLADDLDFLSDTRAILRDLRKEIMAYRERLSCCDEGDSAAHSPDVKRLGTVLHNCIETENRIAKAREQQAGIAQAGVAFDIDAARAEIGRKLARLRDAAGKG